MYTNEGVVSQVSCKPWSDPKTGRVINLYSFQIEGSNRWFRTGENEPTFRQGEFITFTNDAKANVKLQSVTVGNASGGGAPAPAAAPNNSAPQQQPAARPSGVSRDDYWANKEAKDVAKDERYQTVDIPRMSFSATFQPAVDVVCAALANDALSFGTTKKGDKLDYLLDCVDQVHDRFFVQAMASHERLQNLTAGTAEELSREQEQELAYDE